jgi:hypothetical protein
MRLRYRLLPLALALVAQVALANSAEPAGRAKIVRTYAGIQCIWAAKVSAGVVCSTADGKAKYEAEVAQLFVLVRRTTGRNSFFRHQNSHRFRPSIHVRDGKLIHAETHGGIRCEWVRDPDTGGSALVCARADGHGYQITIARPEDGNGAFIEVLNEHAEFVYEADIT